MAVPGVLPFAVVVPTKVRPAVLVKVRRVALVACWPRLVPRMRAVLLFTRVNPLAARVTSWPAPVPERLIVCHVLIAPVPMVSPPMVSVTLAVAPLPARDSSPMPPRVTLAVSPIRFRTPRVLSRKRRDVEKELLPTMIAAEFAMVPDTPLTWRIPPFTVVLPV